MRRVWLSLIVLSVLAFAPSATAHEHHSHPQQVANDPPVEQRQATLFVEWGGTWWAATVNGPTKNGLTPIHYIGWESSWDESVTSQRMARRVDDGRVVVYRGGTWVPATILFKTNDGRFHVHFENLSKELDETVGASRVIRLG